MTAEAQKKSWTRDPLVWLGALGATTIHGWLFFAGEYLPYIDWSNHLGLISILAHGGDSGALTYAERSWLPTPYLLFYALTAAFAQVLEVVAAAKLTLLVATAAIVFGSAYLAEVCGRSPRLALLSPLALFGISLGYGFASFVTALAVIPWALGAAEQWLGEGGKRRWWALAGLLVLSYLAHALVFLLVSALVAIRSATFFGPGWWGRLWRTATAFVPAALAMAPLAYVFLSREHVGEGNQNPGRWAQFLPRDQHLANWGGHLLERGSEAHWLTMKGALALLVGWLALSLWRSVSVAKKSWGLELYAGLTALLYLYGPESLERPMNVWLVYQRFAVVAALLLFLLPRVDLSGWRGIFALPALALVLHNASINRAQVVNFNGWASKYDAVRAAVPKGATVLALSHAGPGDLLQFHPALGSLYFYHLCDGAAYTAFLFDNPLHPVFLKSKRPEAPFWRNPYEYSPYIPGANFQWLVLRGEPFVSRTIAAGLHRRVLEHEGWTVFETLPKP